MNKNWDKFSKYRILFAITISFLSILLPYLSFDYGITCDENIHNIHGRIVYEYFENKNERALINPFDENGGPISVTSDNDDENIRGLNAMGGFFDYISNYTYDKWAWFGEYENRHFINSLFGVLALLFVGLLTMEIAGWRAALLAMLFLLCSPRFFAHSMNNPKDLPFATLYIFCVYQIVLLTKELPNFKWKRILFLIFGIALACDIRISGLLIIPYVFLVGFVFWFLEFIKHRNKNLAKSEIVEELVTPSDFQFPIKKFLKSIGVLFLIGIGGYLMIGIFWPYIRTNPIVAPLIILEQYSNFIFDSYGLYDGQWLHRWEIPWHFIPKWLGITSPLFVLIGILLIPNAFSKSYKVEKQIDPCTYGFVLFTFAFPLLYVIAKKSNVYDDGRHLMFIYPPLIIVTAIAWNHLISILGNFKHKIIAATVLFLFIAEPAKYMIKNHPHEAFYFNPLVGGIDGAFKKYEIDYWGHSMRAAVEWIHENVPAGTPEKPVRVTMWYGSQTQVKYYLDKKPGYVFLWANKESEDWDYCVLLPAYWKFNQSLRETWPPKGTVYQVMVENTPICVVMKNTFSGVQAALKLIQETPSAENYLNLSSRYYQINQWENSIEAAKKAIELNPNFAEAYNNMGAAYGNLGNWDEEIAACAKALILKPDFELANNNLKMASEKKMLELYPERATGEEAKLMSMNLVNQSIPFYNAGNFEKSIELNLRAVKLDPNNSVAFNNLTASYNNLGNWAEASKAGEKAVSLAPDVQLYKNNLNIAKQNLKK